MDCFHLQVFPPPPLQLSTLILIGCIQFYGVTSFFNNEMLSLLLPTHNHMHVCVYVYMYVCMYICMCVCVCMYKVVQI
jgi:hypothetical protein